jgi:Tfp pilus assembly protein PilN
MIVNLITTDGEKKVVKSFYFRLAIVFFLMLSIATFIALIVILPAYFLALNKKNTADDKLSEIEKNWLTQTVDKKDLKTTRNLIDKLNSLEDYRRHKYVISKEVISRIISKKNTGTKITNIFYDNSQQTKKISIEGLSDSRQQLLVFRRALEKDAAFKSVDLPISNFVKGSNISFRLNLISF